MRNAWLYALLALAALALAQSVFASVVINEVLFNPSASANPGDTGLEKIEFYNSSDEPIPMAGWQLYPDGIGYYTFPQGFSLSGKSFVIINLRLAGADDGKNLYHPTVSGNMGNSSGSIAIFNGEPRGKNSIVDFVRYHKPGSAERKTWESAAIEAGLWITGQFIDISNFQEGYSLALIHDGIRSGASSWQILSLPTLGAINSGDQVLGVSGQNQAMPLPPEPGDSSPTKSAPTALPAISSLKAYAGSGRTVFRGGLVEFRGRADGVNGEPLTSGRFLWNFGDGVVKEGRLVSHIYYFPGTYNVSLSVSSGEYSGSDYLKVMVVLPDILISEIKDGKNGFIELYNRTTYRLDLGGLRLTDSRSIFTFETATLIEPRSALVFANAVTGLFQSPGYFSIRDAFDAAIDGGSFTDPLRIEESLTRASSGEQKFIKAKEMTPGVYLESSPELVLKLRKEIEAGNIQQGGDNRQNNAAAYRPDKMMSSELTGPKDELVDNRTVETKTFAMTEHDESTALGALNFPRWFFAISVLIGTLTALGFLFYRIKGW